MSYAERKELIIKHLGSHSFATVEELILVTDASPATIRRDLVKMSNDGLIRKAHGGASLVNYLRVQPNTKQKQLESNKEKSAIALRCASLINDGDAILLDAGATTFQIAQLLADKKVSVVTPDLRIALLLADYPNVEVSLTGGQVDKFTQSCVGPWTDNVLKSIHPNIVFVSCNGWSLEHGITTPSVEKATLKKRLIDSANHKVLVADSKKYGNVAFNRIAPLSDFDQIITDEKLSTDIQHQLAQCGIALSISFMK